MSELTAKYKSHRFLADSSTSAPWSWPILALLSSGSNMVQRQMLSNYVKLCTPIIVIKHTSGIRMRMKLFSFETKNYLNQDVEGQ